MTAVTRAYLAAVRVRQGRLGAAAAILDEWKPRFETIGGVLASPYYEALGELERARGDLAAAEDAHRTRFELLAAAERLEAGRAAAAVADVAALRADWETAAAWAERAADVWHRVGAAASYRQSPEEREADRQNGVAVRILTSPDGEIAAARDLLLAAGERVPWNMWYAINLGYAAAALGDFGEAADAFARASTHAPLQIDALTRLRAEYALRDAAGLLALGEAAQAAQACRSVLADAGPGLGADWYALLARSVGDAELRLGRPGAAAAEYAHALDAGEEWPELRGSTFGRLAVVEAERGRGDESAEFLRRAVDAYAEAGHGREAWWAAADAAAEVAPAPEPLLEQALLQVFDEQVEGGRVQTFRSSIEVAAPADWSVAESFTLTAQDGSGNLIVSGEPLAAPTTVDEYAALQRQHFESALHAFDEVSVTRFALPSGHDAIVRHYTWQTEDDVPITQFQAYVVDGGRGYTATGTTITGSGGLESRLLQLIHGIVLRNGAAET
jgi:hypothetical protein